MNSAQNGLHSNSLDSSAKDTNKTPGISRKNSRSRGIHFKTVSPSLDRSSYIPNTSTRTVHENGGNDLHTKIPDEGLKNSRSDSHVFKEHSGVKSVHKSDFSYSNHTSFDVAIPTSADLEKLDMNEKLRLLALKEMAVVELKDSITNLQSKLSDSERDLSSLRTVIQRSLYRQLKNDTKGELRGHNSRQVSQKLHKTRVVSETCANTDPSIRNIHVKPRKHSAQSHKNSSALGVSDTHPNPPLATDNPETKQSKLWTNLSKPISLIQNLDQMLSQEFEKSLGGDPSTNSHANSVSKETETTTDNLKTFSITEDRDQYRHLMDTKLAGTTSEDMLQAVSNSLWGFVNDMKSNMVSTLSVEPTIDEPDKKRHNSHDNDKPLISLNTSESEESSADLLEFSEEDDEPVDLTMYSAMRKKK